MLRSLTSGVSAMQQFQQQMDVIGNNIANVNTTGFKGARTEFEDAFSQTLSGGSGGVSVQIGTGVGTSAISNQFIQGAIANTGTNTDLAVSGSGFFVVRDTLSDAQFVTRDGAFHLDGSGYLTTAAGMRIQGFSDSALSTRGDILIDASDVQPQRVADATAALNSATTTQASAQTAYDAAKTAADADPTNASLQSTLASATTALSTANSTLTTATAALTSAQNLKVASFNIDNEGKINVRLSDGTEHIRGQVLLQSFRNPQALAKEGGNLYSAQAAAGGLSQTEAPGTSGLGIIKSNALEGSNVDLANEFSSLITTQRAFQASARIITTSDEILQELVSLKR